MQPMANCVKNLYIYSLQGDPERKEKGNAPPKYLRSENTVRVVIVPTSDTVENTPYGVVRRMGSTGFIDGDSLKLGDCLGTADKRLYKVVSLLSFEAPHKQQHAELKEL